MRTSPAWSIREGETCSTIFVGKTPPFFHYSHIQRTFSYDPNEIKKATAKVVRAPEKKQKTTQVFTTGSPQIRSFSENSEIQKYTNEHFSNFITFIWKCRTAPRTCALGISFVSQHFICLFLRLCPRLHNAVLSLRVRSVKFLRLCFHGIKTFRFFSWEVEV